MKKIVNSLRNNKNKLITKRKISFKKISSKVKDGAIKTSHDISKINELKENLKGVITKVKKDDGKEYVNNDNFKRFEKIINNKFINNKLFSNASTALEIFKSKNIHDLFKVGLKKEAENILAQNLNEYVPDVDFVSNTIESKDAVIDLSKHIIIFLFISSIHSIIGWAFLINFFPSVDSSWYIAIFQYVFLIISMLAIMLITSFQITILFIFKLMKRVLLNDEYQDALKRYGFSAIKYTVPFPFGLFITISFLLVKIGFKIYEIFSSKAKVIKESLNELKESAKSNLIDLINGYYSNSFWGAIITHIIIVWLWL